MDSKIKIALAQFDIDWENKISNQKKCQKIIKNAKKNGASLVVFPEMTLTGFSMNIGLISETENSSMTILFFKSMARLNNINIIFGVVLKDEGRKAKNIAVAVNTKGKVISKYQKIHPFSYVKEDDFFEAGKKVAIFKIKNIKFSMIICYDLRFPCLFDAISKHRPDIIVVIANWPQKRITHWDLLLRIRAMDVQSFIVGVNRTGEGNGIKYNGHSSVYAPTGDKIFPTGHPKSKLFLLNKKKVISTRKTFPTLKDKKYNLYKALV